MLSLVQESGEHHSVVKEEEEGIFTSELRNIMFSLLRPKALFYSAMMHYIEQKDSVNPEKLNASVSTKILCSTTVFNIDNNQKCFLSSILL